MTISAYMDLAIRLANIASDYPEDHRHRKTCMEAGDIIAEIEETTPVRHTPTTVPQQHQEAEIVEAVLRAVMQRTGIPSDVLRDRKRRNGKTRVSESRAIAYYILNRERSISTPNLAKHFHGGRSHASIVTAIQRFEKALGSNAHYMQNKPARDWLATVRSAISI